MTGTACCSLRLVGSSRFKSLIVGRVGVAPTSDARFNAGAVVCEFTQPTEPKWRPAASELGF